MEALHHQGEATVGDIGSEELYALLLDELASFLKKSTNEIDVEKTFDEYGLDSIDGVLMTGSISDRLNIDLPPEFLMQYRKVSDAFLAIAALIGVRVDAPAAAPTRLPVYLFAGGAGRDGRLATLAQRCTDKVEGTFIPWGNWHEWLDAGGTLGTIVEASCDRIIALSPDGPLQLAGYSQGGQLAFAVAAELTKRGRTVDLLVMIDSPVKERGKQIGMFSFITRNRRSFLKITLRRAKRVFPFVGKISRVDTDFGEGAISNLSEVVRILPGKAKAIYNRVSQDLNQRDLVIFDNYMQMQYFDLLWERWIVESRQPLPASIHTWLLRSEDEGVNDLGWSEFCETLNIRQVKGTHHSMFDVDNIDELASAFVTIVAATESNDVIKEAESALSEKKVG